MKERLTIMTRKGQITVPVEVRKALGLKVGDKVAVTLADEETGQAALRPVHSVSEMTFGVFAGHEASKDSHALRKTFIDEVAERELAKLEAYVGGQGGSKKGSE